MTRRKRNTSPHRGCWLEKPRGSIGWRACWVDVVTGKTTKVTLDRTRYPSDMARRAFAQRKADMLAAQRLDAREDVVSVPVEEALKLYVAEHRATLRPQTLGGYERVGEIFVAWCAAQRPPLQFAREITKVRLTQFRASRVSKPSDRDPEQIRSAVAINNELRALKTLLIAWTRYDWLPLSRDAIADALRRLPQDQNEIEFLRPKQCKALLRAWLNADAETFALTRREKEGKGKPGSTVRWPAMSPFVATVLLSGMRRGEALALTWGDVNLFEKTIVLRAEHVKTKRGRRFDLALSPGLFAILSGLRLKMKKAPRPEARVFSELTVDTVESARKRMLKRDASKRDALIVLSGLGMWDWQSLRRTCATVLCNMPSAGPWVESKMLGHSVTLSERLYADRLKVAADATTIEQVLGVEPEIVAIAKAIDARS